MRFDVGVGGRCGSTDAEQYEDQEGAKLLARRSYVVIIRTVRKVGMSDVATITSVAFTNYASVRASQSEMTLDVESFRIQEFLSRNSSCHLLRSYDVCKTQNTAFVARTKPPLTDSGNSWVAYD